MCAFALLGALGGTACKEKASPAPPPTSATEPAPAALGATELYVGESKIDVIDRDKAATWPRLDSLMPANARRYGTWLALRGERAKGPFEIKKPGALYGSLVPALFPSRAGAGVSLGLFDPVELARKGEPKISFDELRTLRVELDTSGARGQNDHMGGEATDPNALTLTIEHGGNKVELRGEQLLGLPQDNEPTDDTGEHKGWKLSSILAAAKAPAGKRLLLTGGELNLTLEAEDLDEATSVPFVKLNRQGALRYRTYKKSGEGWRVAGDLRGLSKVQILQ